jgi:hypothetical protein
MWLEAILSPQDLEQALRGLTPTTIQLGDEGALHLEAPESVALVENEGLRIVCGAKLRWAVLGLHLPVTIDSVTLVLEPLVEKRAAGDVLAFKIKLEALDLAAVPAMLEGTVVDHLNVALAARHAELVWDFRETLAQRFDLPDVLDPARTLVFTIAWGELRVRADALVFAVSVHLRIEESTLVPSPVPLLQAPVRARAMSGSLSERLAAASPAQLAVGSAIVALSVSMLGLAVGTSVAHRRRARRVFGAWLGAL